MSDEMGGAVGGDAGGSSSDGGAAMSPDAGNFVAQPDGAEGSEGAEGEGQEADPAKAKAKAAAKYKVKFGGQDREGTLEDLQKWASDDFEHEVTVDGAVERLRYPELHARARLGSAAFARMREAKAAEARYQGLEKQLMENPVSVFERAGRDPLQWAIEQVQAEAQLEQMQATDPRGYAQKIVERERRIAEAKSQREAQQKQAEQQQADKQRMRKATYEALPQAMGLKMSPLVNGVVGQLMHDAERSGHAPEVAELAMLAKSQIRRDMQAMVSDMNPEQLRELIGDAAMKRLRQSDVASAREAEKKRLGIGNQNTAPATGPKPTQGALKPTVNQILRGVIGGKS